MPLEVLEGSVFQLFPHPTIRKERRGQPRRGSGVFPARAGLASPTMGIRAPWGGLCRAASPNWGGEGSRDAGGSPGHLPPPSEVTWVSQSQTADPPEPALVLLPPKVCWGGLAFWRLGVRDSQKGNHSGFHTPHLGAAQVSIPRSLWPLVPWR